MTPEWVDELTRQLGYEPNVVSEMRLLPEGIEVVFYLTKENGSKYLVLDSSGERVPAMDSRRHSYDEVTV